MKKLLIAAAIAATLALAMTLGNGSAQAQADLNCADFPTQVDVANSLPAGDPYDLDGDGDGIGCDANNPPLTAYDTTSGQPVAIGGIPPVTTTTLPALPAQPADPTEAEPNFTG